MKDFPIKAWVIYDTSYILHVFEILIHEIIEYPPSKEMNKILGCNTAVHYEKVDCIFWWPLENKPVVNKKVVSKKTGKESLHRTGRKNVCFSKEELDEKFQRAKEKLTNNTKLHIEQTIKGNIKWYKERIEWLERDVVSYTEDLDRLEKATI